MMQWYEGPKNGAGANTPSTDSDCADGDISPRWRDQPVARDNQMALLAGLVAMCMFGLGILVGRTLW